MIKKDISLADQDRVTLDLFKSCDAFEGFMCDHCGDPVGIDRVHIRPTMCAICAAEASP